MEKNLQHLIKAENFALMNVQNYTQLNIILKSVKCVVKSLNLKMKRQDFAVLNAEQNKVKRKEEFMFVIIVARTLKD